MKRMTTEELAALPVTVDVVTAGRAFGLGRDATYRMARLGRLPVPVLRMGRKMVVTKGALLAALGVDPGKPLASVASPQVSAAAPDAVSDGQAGDAA